jgi:hypothetical protein
MEAQNHSFVESAREVLAANVRWGRYLVMMGYVLTALVVVVGLASMLIGVAASSAVGSITLVIYLAVAALYYMPIERLNRFVKGCSMALETGDERALIEGLYGLSRAMRMLVIYTVVVLAIYAVIFLFALVFGLSSSLIGA